MNRAHIVGRLVLTTCVQSAGAPVVDSATVTVQDGRPAGGWCIRRRPESGRALVVAVLGRTSPRITTVRRLLRVPILGRLFATRYGRV